VTDLVTVRSAATLRPRERFSSPLISTLPSAEPLYVAGPDGIGHATWRGHPWTACSQPATPENLAHPRASICSPCVKAVEDRSPLVDRAANGDR
jgi:hypothetical protein